MVGKPAATPITSSPGLIARSPRRGEVSAENASKLADEPELVVSTQRRPRYLAKRFSNASLKRPVVSQPSSTASVIACSSPAPITLPEGGTLLCPATKGFGAICRSA
ncbi:hypothetical protein D3C76_1537410 [compost metagenome]